jgi:steroid 5-alpha reductase family enzyme
LGIIVYKNLDFAFYINLLIADVAATAFVFLFSVILKNASVYDPYWSVQPPVILACLMIESGASAAGIVITAAVSVWALRLTANWAYTFGDLTHQDWRYTMLSEKCGAFYPIINFLGIHLVPTLVVYLCVLPAAFVIRLGAELSWVALFPLLLSLFATAMQGIADFQMHKFRKSGVGGFIRVGLWRYSRHPNYLGEILMWWGVGIYSVILLAGYAYLLVGALANTLLFTFVSIPMAEKKQARKNGFDEYKRQTRFLLPVKK